MKKRGLPDLPGADELRSMCANARRVADLCELLGVELDGMPRAPRAPLYSRPGAFFLEELGDDEDEPYIWDM